LLVRNVARRTGSPVIEPEQIADFVRVVGADRVVRDGGQIAQFWLPGGSAV
jgi:hypothetical protein